MTPRHPFVTATVGLASLVLLAVIAIMSAKQAAFVWFDVQWRPFGWFIVLSMLAVVGLMGLLVKQVRTKTGTYYWMIGLLSVNLAWLGIILMHTISRTPEAAVFWQSLIPIAAILISPSVLYFVLSYIDEVDVPQHIILRLLPLVVVVVLLYVSGASNLIESHVPSNIKLEYWGWQSNGGPLGPFALAWAITLMAAALAMLLLKYQQVSNTQRRQQMRIFIIGLSAYCTLGAGIDFVLYYTNPHLLPSLAFAYTTILAGSFSYGLLRYGLLRVSVAAQSGIILENLAEAVLGVDPDGRIQFCNTTAEIMFAASRSDLVGSDVTALLGPPTRRAYTEGLRQPGTTTVLEDATVIDTNERRIPATLTCNRLYDDHQRLAGSIIVVQNLAELRKKAIELEREKRSVERKVIERTRQLHDEQAKLRASIDSLTSGFAVIDSRGTIIEQNSSWQVILGAPSRPATLAASAKFFQHFNLTDQATQSIRAGKTLLASKVARGDRVVRVYTSPVQVDSEGQAQTIGAVVLLEDVTEATVLERSRDEFFSIASHELRTPLTAIKGNASLLSDYLGKKLDAPTREVVEDIKQSSDRLIAIVNDFLDVSRLEQGRMLFRLQPLSLEPLIEQVAYELKSLINAKNLKLELETLTLDQLPQVTADPARVKQVLYNIVGNAVIYTAEGGIRISSSVGRKTVTIYVTDTGRGIPKDGRKLLFHKFQQAGDSLYTRDSTRGTGLGLYISKLTLEKMGGSIELEASAVGRGSTFSLTLPRA